jgi:hypothetical protein
MHETEIDNLLKDIIISQKYVEEQYLNHLAVTINDLNRIIRKIVTDLT